MARVKDIQVESSVEVGDFDDVTLIVRKGPDGKINVIQRIVVDGENVEISSPSKHFLEMSMAALRHVFLLERYA